MTDIVERLRDNAPVDHGLASGDLMREAADEIERLTALWEARGVEIDRLNAEIERLQAEVTLWRERYEAERRDHEATIKHADKAMNEGP
jgi:hypothetical protein